MIDLNILDITYQPPLLISLPLSFFPSLPLYSLIALKHIQQYVLFPLVILTFFFILAQHTFSSLQGLIYCVYVYGRVCKRDYMNFIRTL